jgi:AcrR family transcriptional regulator
MPKLWDTTIDAHRRAVRDAAVDAAAELVASHGLRSVTMSQIAQTAGVGRATLYKYFPDVESILTAWHDRQVSSHLQYLAEVSNRAGNASERLEAVLEAYAVVFHQFRRHHGSELAAFLHRGERVGRAHDELHGLVAGLLREGIQAGFVREDVAAEELAAYCLSALGAAERLTSRAAIRRLVAVTLAGLRPPR